MHVYCRLKNGKIMIVWSDNPKDESMDLYELSELEDFDPDFLRLKTVYYSEIDRTNTNLSTLK